MHAEASYWTLLTADDAASDPTLAELLAAWLAAGNRSLRDLFEMHPDVLAAAMGRSLDDLQPLLRLRDRRPQVERLLDRLARAHVDLLAPWDRGYPRALKEIEPNDVPAPLWYLGSPAILGGKIVAVIGARDSGAEAVAFARAAGGALAASGKTVLAGVARAVERGALEGATVGEGKAIGLLGQGIARALPDLQRLQPRVRAGSLLLIGTLHPETAWQQGLEEAGNRVLLALAERVVVAQAGAADSTMQAAAQALDAGKPVLVGSVDAEGNRALLEHGGIPIAWPAESAAMLEAAVLAQPPALVQLLREAPRSKTVREADEPLVGGATQDERARPAISGAAGAPATRAARSRAASPEDQSRRIDVTGVDPPAPNAFTPSDAGEPANTATNGPVGVPGQRSASIGHERGENQPKAPRGRARGHTRPDGAPASTLPEEQLAGAILRCLQRRKRPTPKGALLQALAVTEGSLDRALAALIAAGRVQERLHRAGTAYGLPQTESGTAEARFQLSLFGQQATPDDDRHVPEP